MLLLSFLPWSTQLTTIRAIYPKKILGFNNILYVRPTGQAAARRVLLLTLGAHAQRGLQ